MGTWTCILRRPWFLFRSRALNSQKQRRPFSTPQTGTTSPQHESHEIRAIVSNPARCRFDEPTIIDQGTMSTNTTMHSKADGEPQPRTKSLATPMDFRPRSAVKILNDGEVTEITGFLKTWTLARLLAWMILDQPPRKTTRGTLRLRRANANHAGLVVLASLLHLRLQKIGHASSLKSDEPLKRMFHLWLKCDGFSACFQRRGGKALCCDHPPNLIHRGD
jgi:hypothetical protein